MVRLSLTPQYNSKSNEIVKKELITIINREFKFEVQL